MSALFTSDVMDKLHHKLTRKSPYAKSIIKYFGNGVKSLLKWMDDHPEYVLIVLSDHGGGAYKGEDSVNLHGENTNGNQAFISFYNPKFSFATNGKMKEGEYAWLNTVDVCSTICMYWHNCSIPFENVGLVCNIKCKKLHLGECCKGYKWSSRCTKGSSDESTAIDIVL